VFGANGPGPYLCHGLINSGVLANLGRSGEVVSTGILETCTHVNVFVDLPSSSSLKEERPWLCH
jgi:hypothetical protein